MLGKVIAFALFIIIGLWIKRDKNSSRKDIPLKERLLESLVGLVGVAILIAMFCFCYWLVYNHTIIAFVLLGALLYWAWYDNRGKEKKDQR